MSVGQYNCGVVLISWANFSRSFLVEAGPTSMPYPPDSLAGLTTSFSRLSSTYFRSSSFIHRYVGTLGMIDLREVVFDHIRHERINHFIVGHPAPGALANATLPFSQALISPGTPNTELGSKASGSRKVINPTVDHIHPLQPINGFHVHAVV